MSGLVLVVFTAVYLGMAIGRWPGLKVDRTGIALLGAIVLYGSGALDGAAVLDAIDFPPLVVLFGLMILSAQFAACGFYDWCSARIATAALPPAALLAITVAAAGILSAVLANDVVVFAMTPMLCAGLIRRGVDARPFVIALAGGANAGSAATIIGNPQNILIGEVGGLDFWRFLLACAPPALAALACVFLVVWWRWRTRLRAPPALAAVPRSTRPGSSRRASPPCCSSCSSPRRCRTSRECCWSRATSWSAGVWPRAPCSAWSTGISWCCSAACSWSPPRSAGPACPTPPCSGSRLEGSPPMT